MSKNKNKSSSIWSFIKLQFLSILQDRLIFKPLHGKVQKMKEPVEYGLSNAEIISICTEDNINIKVWYKKTTDVHKPVIIFFHGNTGHFGDVGKAEKGETYDRQYRINVLREIEKSGAGYVAVSLRGYGISQKVKSSEEGFIKDTKAVIYYVLDKLGIPNERIILFGESLGGAVAMIAAEQMTIIARPPAVVSTVATFSSMYAKVTELHSDLSPSALEKKLRHKFDSEKRLKKLAKDTHFFVCHPGDDRVTLKDHSKKLAEIARESGFMVTYKELDGAGHINWDAAQMVKDILGVYYKKQR